jgi:hypothetical protein
VAADLRLFHPADVHRLVGLDIRDVLANAGEDERRPVNAGDLGLQNLVEAGERPNWLFEPATDG